MFIVSTILIKPKMQFAMRNSFKIFYKIPSIGGRQMSVSSLTSTRFDKGIRTVTMTNPKTRNALSIGMLEELIRNVAFEWENPELRVIVLAGEGPVFSAGHNLKELVAEFGREQHDHVFKLCGQLMSAIIDCPVPVIAKVDGLATAAGCQLVAQCDLAICSERSTFCTPGVKVGIFCSTPGVAVARCVPKMTALNMLFTGKVLSSAEAKACSLVSEVCPNEALDEEIQKMAQAVINSSRSVVELGKKFYYHQIHWNVKNAYEAGGRVMVDNINLKDGQEGISSFIEKRKPTWSHTFNKS